MATTLAHAISPLEAYPEERLPESDGKPMAETDSHRKQMVDLLLTLEDYFRDDPLVYVTGNIFFYYRDETNTRQSVSPDVLVVRGVEKKIRRIYNLETEGKAPDVVIELTSMSTKMEDLGNKKFTYAYLGVKEYFLFDPFGETIQPALRGFRLEDGDYVPMVGARLNSEALGLDLKVEKGWLRLYDRKTGELLPTPEEVQTVRRKAEAKAAQAFAARQAAEAKAAQELAARQAAEAKAAQELAARQAAEAEVLRLREELASYKASKK